MRLSELKKYVDFAVGYLHGEEDPEVVITLANKSVGARAATSIKHIGMGMDWESGQVRIEPGERLYREGRTLDDSLKTFAIKYIYDKRVSIVHHCPKCEAIVKKDSRFCSQCGQCVSINSEVNLAYDYRTK